ncbi:MAG: hypothetical protein ACYDAG_10995 [Chloroflexota bacterium]
MDPGQKFPTCSAVFAYAPRAFALTFLDPTPRQWFQPGGSTGDARYLAAVDAVMLWLVLPGLLVGLLHAIYRPKAVRVALAVYVVVLGFALGFAVTNFGTLFRLRLEVILPAVILAADGWALLLGWVGPAGLRRFSPRGTKAHPRSGGAREEAASP